MARPEPASDSLDRLISQSEAALQRIENLKEGRTGQPASQRVVAHLTKHGSHITNLALAGCVLVVAYGQVTLKRKHEVLVVPAACAPQIGAPAYACGARHALADALASCHNRPRSKCRDKSSLCRRCARQKYLQLK